MFSKVSSPTRKMHCAASTRALFRHAAVLLAGITMFCAGLARAQSPYEGYTLFSPNNGRVTYLVDMDGNTVHTWQHGQTGGYATYLLEDGSLLRPASLPNAQLRGAASAGLLERIAWDGTVLWSYQYSGAAWISHHDIEPMPNGNILMIAWEVKSAAEAEALGRQNARTMWPDHIVEVKPLTSGGGEIVWEWHAWDHLIQDRDASKPGYGVISEHPERIDINLLSQSMGPGGGDWLHINGISYNAKDDLIVISSHFMNELYVIDHSTTTEEARGSTGGRHGKGGDILYRWGNPANFGASGAQVFDVVHCSLWIPEDMPGAGNILAFNNAARARASEIIEIVPPRDAEGRFIRTAGEAFGPGAAMWTYSAGSSFFSNHLGGNQRLPNGNTFLTEATSGDLREVAADGTVVWEYNYSREIARALRYGRDYPGVSRLTTTGAGALAESPDLMAWSTPNPFSSVAVLHFRASAAGSIRLAIHDGLGREVRVFDRVELSSGTGQLSWDGRDAVGRSVPPGMYFLRSYSGDQVHTARLIRQ